MKITPNQLRQRRHIKRVVLRQWEETYRLKSDPKEKRVRTKYVFGFRWSDTGKAVKGADLKWAKSVKVPPSVGEVCITPDPKSNLRAVWTDAKGRSVPLYAPKFTAKQARAKHDRVQQFEAEFPKLFARVMQDVDNAHYKTSEAARALYIIALTGMRPGGNGDTRAEVKAYGAVTLLCKHVRIVDKETAVFDFVGKKGVRQRHTVHDRLLVRILTENKSTSWSSRLFDVSPGFVNTYLDSISNGQFNVKDFRSRLANTIVRQELEKRKGPADTETQFKRWQRQAADKVAHQLGHSPTQSINNYIDPRLWQKWRKPEWGPFVPKPMKAED